jgi:sulfide:quinone oxidoreductase
MADRTVVVLGGGTGGLVAAHQLRRLLDPSDRVVVVERDHTYRYAPSFLWVLTGARRPAQITADLRRLRRRGIEFVEADILGIDPTQRRVKTTEAELTYDRLVVSLGAELAPDALPGFSDGAHNVYTLDGALHARAALQRLHGGRVAVLVSRLPYKCPAAPYETAFLVEALLRRRGVRDGSHIDIYTPEPLPMPTAGPVLGEALRGMLHQRGIGFHPESTVERVDTKRSQLVLADGERVVCNLLLGVPPHRAPQVVRDSGLAGENGFIPVDPATLQTGAEGVFAIGDVTAIPIADGKFLPKAGVFAHAEAEVVARRIAGELAGRRTDATFDGAGACFVELGDGQAAYATGRFYGEGGPQINLRRPGRHWHAAKVGLEQYWMRRWF